MKRNEMIVQTENLKETLGLEMAKVKTFYRLMEATDDNKTFNFYINKIQKSLNLISVYNDAIIGNLIDLKETKWEPGEPIQEDLEEWQEIE